MLKPRLFLILGLIAWVPPTFAPQAFAQTNTFDYEALQSADKAAPINLQRIEGALKIDGWSGDDTFGILLDTFNGYFSRR